jgi:hypothetical protein
MNNNNVEAESLFKTLITEIEKRRELNIKKHAKLILEADEDLDMDLDMDMDLDETAEGDDVEDISTEEESVDDDLGDLGDLEADETADDIDADGEIEGEESDAEAEAQEIVDTTNAVTDINCEVNAKVISLLFDKLADIKSRANALSLDPSSREAIKYSVTIEYYSDKLLELQSKTTPETDQTRVEEALNAIETALDSLIEELGGEEENDFDEVKTPKEVTDEALPEEDETEGEELAEDESAEVEEDEADEVEEVKDSEEESGETEEEFLEEDEEELLN